MKLTSYLLRDIDPALWRRVSRRAKGDRIKLRSLILGLLERYAAGELELPR